MALTKLGDYIELREARNKELRYRLDAVRGISIQKKFIDTKADMTRVSLAPYFMVSPNDFAYVTVTSRNGEKITIAHNDTNDTYLVSSSYVVFNVSHPDLLHPDYLFMWFNRPEFDRYARFNSWGSARETFSFEELCDIDIDLPPLSVQQKYVNIYNAMLANQRSYERGLEDLKLVCDGYFDALKKDDSLQTKLGDIIDAVDQRNVDGLYGKENVKGISNAKEFIKTKADISKTDLSKFLVISPNYFAYNSRTDGREMLVLALNDSTENIIVTWNYNAFKIKNDVDVNPAFLYAYFKRAEFDRLVRFMSWGSSQELLTWDNLCAVKVPIPSRIEQDAIATMSRIYLTRKAINEKLKTQIKSICPILIKGSLNEGRVFDDKA